MHEWVSRYVFCYVVGWVSCGCHVDVTCVRGWLSGSQHMVGHQPGVTGRRRQELLRCPSRVNGVQGDRWLSVPPEGHGN